MKCYRYLLLVLVLFMLGITNVQALNTSKINYNTINISDDESEIKYFAGTSSGSSNVVCKDVNVLKALKIVSFIIVIFKIMAPLVITITGIISLVKATISQDDGEIKTSISNLIKKFFIGVTIFFVPTIINAFLSIVKGYDTTSGQFSKCAECLVSIKKCK